jgi:predicted TIM-barrel fold metal-dependent hydrolase
MIAPKIIDSHMHVGLVGDRWPELGGLSNWYRSQLSFRIFLMYARVDPNDVSDEVLHTTTLRTVRECGLDHVVGLALDPVYDLKTGTERRGASHVWVSNEYVLQLNRETNGKLLFGCSVHPYDDDFEARVDECVANGAVLIKWLPSAQQIDLAEPIVRQRLEYLATAKNKAARTPLPLLLHVGPEYAIPTSDPRTMSYDYFTWTWRDKLSNMFRKKEERWHVPKLTAIHGNLEAGLKAGATIICAHAGTPYFTSGFLSTLFGEHSDLARVKQYLDGNAGRAGKVYTDVSAFCTPFRKAYFKEVGKIDPDYVLYGSDFPTPAFELSAGHKEFEEDFRAVMSGELERVIIPEDNLLDVNYRELAHAFPGHRMFTNFSRLL